ncbi:sensor histidine kinase [Actinosynnema pretiosum]|uniref:histidine kinase n=1 Tax=Actinosynnema pretiosum TaxID=42197 RepID=A0A290Z0Y1_9PSEU|nr:sensor histidine kinase [Actinosynnema pretiosum]ATE52664.1 histidine kinase [Actinosynnema pretiosum]
MTARVRPVAGRAAGYFLLAPVTGVVWCLLLVPLTLLGLATAPVLVGLPLLALAMVLARASGGSERGLARVALGVDVHPPAPRVRPSGRFGWVWGPVRDAAAWRALLYQLLVLVPRVVQFAVLLAASVAAVVLIALPLATLWLPFAIAVDLGGGREWLIDSWYSGLPAALLGGLLWLALLHGLRTAARWQGWLVRVMLGPSRTAELTAEAQRLHASRARGVEAAEAERRRIERDLHDGAQQRLVSVAMSLGRAKSKLGSDPEAVRALIDEAHADAKLAISELRDLARGIYPSVLGDRGLDAALSSLAARCPVPVEVSVKVEPRPPTAVESTAYFTVAEALTNITKHSGATRARVAVSRTGTSVVVEVVDNGRGGASVRQGGGLAGLADRAATIDGVVTVVSPVGGPTSIRTELPCAW